MKEELSVTFEIPEEFICVDSNLEYYIPEDFPYKKVVNYIKDFSERYYGVGVEVDIDALKPVQSKTTPSKWSITYKWIDEPNYAKLSSMFHELSNFGHRNKILLDNPPRRSYYEQSDYANIQEILKNMYNKKLSRKDILKSMFRNIKTHLIALK